MTRGVGFLRSTIGRKIVMAVTGVVLVGFVVAHMSGNLLVYVGPAAMNEYSEFLHHFLHGLMKLRFRGVLGPDAGHQ